MRFLAKCAIAAFALASVISGGASAQQNNAAAKAEVEKLTREFVAAYGQGPAGLEKYFSYYADDMFMVNARGRGTKADYEKLWRGMNGNGGGVAASDIKDLQSQVSPSGDAVVTAFLMPVQRRGTLQPGQDRDITWIMNGTWFKVGGTWKIKNLMYVMVAPPAAPAGAAPAAPAPAAR